MLGLGLVREDTPNPEETGSGDILMETAGGDMGCGTVRERTRRGIKSGVLKKNQLDKIKKILLIP